MKLAELDAYFVRSEGPGYRRHVEFAEAQGIVFVCPKCKDKDGHSVCVWFIGRGVPEDEPPLPRWSFNGTSLENLTIFPSIDVKGCWHGWITNGDAK